MSTGATERRAVYRKRTSGRRAELWDDLTGVVCAVTEVSGRAAFSRLDIECPIDGSRWTSSPNRKIMPTSWRLVESTGSRATGFHQRVAPKLFNPLGRRLLSLERSWSRDRPLATDEPSGAALLHVVDASGAGRLLGVTVSDWLLIDGETPVATFGFARRPRARNEDGNKGLLGRARELADSIGSSDRALTSLGGSHAIAPAEALVLLILFEALTDIS